MMNKSNDKTREITNIQDINVNSFMDEWLKEVNKKNVEELDINDVCRMIRQGILTEVALIRAIEVLKHEPLAGAVYDGQLIELLNLIDFSKYKQHIITIRDVLVEIYQKADCNQWLDIQDYEEYTDNIQKILRTIEINYY